MKRLFSFLISLFIFVLPHWGCPDDDGVNPPQNPLHITVEDITCTETYLKLSLASSETNRTVTLKRSPASTITSGDTTIVTITLASNDSLLVDEKLLPNKTYTYTLIKDNWTATAQATTQDTTTHNVQWQLPDTLGVQGLIRDVWAFSKTDAWAVGEIYLADSTGKPNMSNPYNASHWNGSKWEVKQIKVNFRGNMITPPLNGTFAFSPTDIWLSSGVPIHGNGETWTQYHLYDMGVLSSTDGSINKLWGKTSSDLFFVGNKGTIVHYSNGTWTKQESHTTVDLQDIWGIDATHVWATGTNTADGHCVVLQYDGKQWKTIYDNTNKPPNELFGFKSVWSDRTDRIYLAGDAYSSKMNLNDNTLRLMGNTAQQWVAFSIRGMGQGDIFQVGSAGETIHFNGYRWYLYPELKVLNEGFAGFNSVYPTTDFVLIGGLYLTALNGFPVVVRGYR